MIKSPHLESVTQLRHNIYTSLLCQSCNCLRIIDISGSHALCWTRSPHSTMSIYTENGYANRKDYLDELRDEYGSDMVNTLLTVLPASEDFDGLVSALEDAMDSF